MVFLGSRRYLMYAMIVFFNFIVILVGIALNGVTVMTEGLVGVILPHHTEAIELRTVC